MARKQRTVDEKENQVFATKLRNIMDEKGINQAQIAEKIGKSRQVISQYMHGQSEPTFDTLCKIADFFNVSTDYLLGRTNDSQRLPCAVDDLGLSEKAVKMMRNIRSLDDSTDILTGLSIILEGVNTIFIAKNIKLLADAIQAEVNSMTNTPIPAQSTFQSTSPKSSLADLYDANFGESLVKQLEEAHPELAGRIAVSCGRSVLDMKINEIIQSFDTEIKTSTGYFEYLAQRYL